MEMQQIQHFLVTVRTGSLARAAESLNLTQSGLSRSIKTLEDFLGTVLFERGPRGASLTAAGERLLPEAEAIWNRRARIIDDMNAYKLLKWGGVKFGLHTVFAYELGPKVLNQFAADHPDVDVFTTAATEPKLHNQLLNGELDFGFTLFHGPPADPALEYEDIFALPSSIYARASHVLAGRPTRIDQLSASSWALGGDYGFEEQFRSYFATRGSALPSKILRCSSIALLLNLVASRDLLTVLPDIVGARAAAPEPLVRIDADAPAARPRGGLIYRSDLVRTPSIQAMMDLVRTAGQALNQPPPPI
jgi:DNA-binding transcriptional LysR family regulator